MKITLLVVGLFVFGGCTIQRADSVRVTREAIGSMRVDRPIGELRGMMPNATDTTVTIAQTVRPGVAFHFPDLTVVATQQRDSLDPSRPADLWTLTGCGGQLPNTVPLCANWQELTRAFGRTGTGTTASGPAVVRLCRLPGFEFELDVGQGTVGSLETAPDLARVPGTARIERVTLSRTATDSCESPGR
ncbi:MAG: hypothetical protein ACREOK_09705 [Gemmatimonadaceae bacterium]